MPAPLTQVVKQCQQDWTVQLEPKAILTACHDVGSEWRDRCLDPVTTTQVFFVPSVNGNTACTHLRHLTKSDVSASAYGQARSRLPLEVFKRLLRAMRDDVHKEPLAEGRWLGHRTFWADGSSVLEARYAGVARALWPTWRPEARWRVSGGPPDGAVSRRQRFNPGDAQCAFAYP